VLTGAVVGTGIGIAMLPLLHGRRDDVSNGTPTASSAASLAPGNAVSLAMQF
jgi:hypothetical protein